MWCFPSQEMLGQPDLSEIHPIKHVDILLLSEWGVMAQNKLLEIAQVIIYYTGLFPQ